MFLPACLQVVLFHSMEWLQLGRSSVGFLCFAQVMMSSVCFLMPWTLPHWCTVWFPRQRWVTWCQTLAFFLYSVFAWFGLTCMDASFFCMCVVCGPAALPWISVWFGEMVSLRGINKNTRRSVAWADQVVGEYTFDPHAVVLLLVELWLPCVVCCYLQTSICVWFVSYVLTNDYSYFTAMYESYNDDFLSGLWLICIIVLCIVVPYLGGTTFICFFWLSS